MCVHDILCMTMLIVTTHVKEATWVPSSALENAKKAVQDFEGRNKPGKRQK